MRERDIVRSRESVYDLFTSQVLDAEELIRVTSGTEGREIEVYFPPINELGSK